MKARATMLLLSVGALAFAQSSDERKGRVGINTESPMASLEVSRRDITSQNETIPQGVIFPHITTTERDKFDTTKLKAGTMIYNTTTNYVDVWTGSTWRSIDYVPLPVVTYTATKTYSGDAEFTRGCYTATTKGKVRYTATETATATSTISQADADAKALAQAESIFNRNGQAKADEEGVCEWIYTNYKLKTYCDVDSSIGGAATGEVFVDEGNRGNKVKLESTGILKDIWYTDALLTSLSQFTEGGTFTFVYNKSYTSDENPNLDDVVCKFEILP